MTFANEVMNGNQEGVNMIKKQMIDMMVKLKVKTDEVLSTDSDTD